MSCPYKTQKHSLQYESSQAKHSPHVSQKSSPQTGVPSKLRSLRTPSFANSWHRIPSPFPFRQPSSIVTTSVTRSGRIAKDSSNLFRL